MSGLPGGVSVSHLRVYDWPAPDGVGLAGQRVAAPARRVVGGLRRAGRHRLGAHARARPGSPCTRCGPGSIVSFGPGVVHRAVNDGDLEVLVLMSNAGLPEAGDAVLTFPAAVLADPAAYRAAATLPGDGASDDEIAAAARRRRDLALEGYAELGAAVDRLGAAAALEPLHDAAARLVRTLVPHWQDVWTRTVYARDRGHGRGARRADPRRRPPPRARRRDGGRGRPGAAAVRHVRSSADLADARPG